MIAIHKRILNLTACALFALLHVFPCAVQCQPSDTLQTNQTDLIDYTARLFRLGRKSDQIREERKTRFSIIPIAPGTAGGDQIAVSAINASFYLSDPQDTYLSTLYFYPYTNFSSKGGFIFSGSLWAQHNRWNSPIDLRLLRSNAKVYGLGGGTTKSDYQVLDYSHFRSYITFNRLIIRKFYFGLGYNLDIHYKIKAETEYDSAVDTQTVSSGITLNLIRDSRKNSINPQGGFYTALIFRCNTRALGSDSNWNSIYFDARKYFPFLRTKHSLLATRTLYWGTFSETPYLDLPGTFLDLSGRAGRGYFTGRYRGKHMLYAECEYRLQLSANGFWGVVFFVNGQSFTEPDSGNFEYILPGVGTGLRIKFNKKSDVNITLDFAVGKDSFNWYLNLGEFF